MAPAVSRREPVSVAVVAESWARTDADKAGSTQNATIKRHFFNNDCNNDPYYRNEDPKKLTLETTGNKSEGKTFI